MRNGWSEGLEPTNGPVPPSRWSNTVTGRLVMAGAGILIGTLGYQFLLKPMFAPDPAEALPAVGSCLHVSGDMVSPEIREADCTAADANELVTEVVPVGGADGGDLRTHCDPMEEALLLRPEVVPADGICLRMNVEPGECWEISEVTWPQPSDCSGPVKAATVVVIEGVHHGTVDEARCGPTSVGLPYLARDLLVCAHVLFPPAGTSA